VSIERTCREALGENDEWFTNRNTPGAFIEFKLRFETYSPNDIRAMGSYLSPAACEEIKAACDRFLASRGKLTGRDYAKLINRKHHDI
jgi:hypothetical protein